MPVRLLRPGIRTSEAWNATSFRAQSLYIGILTLVDDYGRYDGRSQLLHAEIFGLRDNVTRQNTANDLRELGEHGLVVLYTVEGKEYLQLTHWREHARSVPRYPEPSVSNCMQMQTDASKCSPPTPSPTPSPSPSPSSISSTTQGNGATAPSVSDISEEIYQSYPRKEGKDDALRAIRKRIKDGIDPQFLLGRVKAYAAAIVWKERKYIPHPATWFNHGHYDDDPAEWNDPGKARQIDSNQQRRNSEYERFMAERAQKTT